ncbi:class I SAM-dependent methyltransferase [Pseudomonas entomophila]|uniref:Class I SAM-dependent methyltransferase n=2 Tax=Pseudomonas entomophila TaxID=312306 RepID=A0ABY9QQ70_9PSED|nr:class I SAM-dependent methyltransferase [Pseudomonas entomophila]WMW05929.1 class I SAM-dependent methyltransferase [Pseudomonas entomophila]CAK13223.1 putative SAM-dependent methyltransferase [Pseudomonas entomophila L48]
MTNTLDSYIGAYSDRFGYAFDNDIILNWYPQRIMQLCQAQDSILELGVGHGFSTNRFSQFFASHTVIDGSASVIAQFREQFPESPVDIVEGYFEHFDSPRTFDLIVMGFVLEHVDDPQTVLQRFRRFLAPGGRLFVLVPNGESLHRRFGHAAGLLGNMMSLGQGDLELGHQRVYSLDSLTRELTDAGYQVTRKEGVFLKPFMTSQLVKLELSEQITGAMCTVGIDYPELSCALMLEATAN